MRKMDKEAHPAKNPATPPTRLHLAELLLAAKLRGERDSFRARRDFSEDIQQVHAILFNRKARKLSKIAAYREWLKKNQPCVFGRAGATKKQVFTCMLDEHEILNMRRGDEDLRDTIRDHQRVWKRRALHGLSSSFVIVLNSPALAHLAPGPELKEICRRFMELYIGADVEDDTIISRHEFVYLAQEDAGKLSYLRFATLPNIFCAQADKRWWHDHRTPAGLMITSNALGHYMHSQGIDPTRSLKMAMSTIRNAHREEKPKKGLPATSLLPRPNGESSPLENDPELAGCSAHRYAGYFHTDHLIPSVFFESKPPSSLIKDLDLSYIHDPATLDHAELVKGEPVDWYTVRNEIWLRSGQDLLKRFSFDEQDRKEAFQWLEQRLWARCRG